jgi:hypothetical protein
MDHSPFLSIGENLYGIESCKHLLGKSKSLIHKEKSVSQASSK